MNTDQAKLNACGCCDAIELMTPQKTSNRAGLDALRFRIGAHGAFKESMLRQLSKSPALRELTTREDDDSTIALMDAWAIVLDVLTFYNERIINEGYIRTSLERLSLVELSRHISYLPKPGVAASAWLSFFMDESVGVPAKAKVPGGTKVQSIPGQDEMPQMFETTEKIWARRRWNGMRTKLTEPQALTSDSASLYLDGTDAQLYTGDHILMVVEGNDSANSQWSIHSVEDVDIIRKENTTLVTLQQESVDNGNPITNTDSGAQIYAFRQRAALFGYNAPDYRSLSDDVEGRYSTDHDVADWINSKIIDTNDETIFLDAVYPKIFTGSKMVLMKPDGTELFNVIKVTTASKKEFTLANKSTKIELVGGDLSEFSFRDTMVLAQSEELTLAAEVPRDDSITGNTIELAKFDNKLSVGQHLIITGKSDETGNIESEYAEIKELSEEDGEITLHSDLTNKYEGQTVTINANITHATHGETKTEILGSGDGGQIFQKFKLRQKPLTYISASTPRGVKSTLRIWVNDIRWKGVRTFYDKGPEDKIFITRTEDDGTVAVQFGDGITGERLPSGIDNIKAKYRVGTGLDGVLKEDQLSLLMTPQLGIKAVTNELPTSGAEDPETLEGIKRNAPMTVLTLDRIVSIRDYEEFANAYAGIGKARADLLWKGENRTVHITVASPDAGIVDRELKQNLIDAINAARHDNFAVVVESFDDINRFNVAASIKVERGYTRKLVIDQVKEDLISAFSFESRDFGQDVTPSEVIAVIQLVEGVIAVDLDSVNGQDPFDTDMEHFRLPSLNAKWSGATILPAELLLIDENSIEINQMNL